MGGIDDTSTRIPLPRLFMLINTNWHWSRHELDDIVFAAAISLIQMWLELEIDIFCGDFSGNHIYRLNYGFIILIRIIALGFASGNIIIRPSSLGYSDITLVKIFAIAHYPMHHSCSVYRVFIT